MSNEITQFNNASNLPAEVSTEIRLLSTSPVKYLEALPIERMDAERPPNAIMLSQYKRSLDRKQQLMYLGMMITEVNDFFNVKGNMNAKQIKLTAELILDNPGFYDLTLGNIKACFRHKMATAKLYDRLDGNIIIDWLREFKSDMAEFVYDTKIKTEDTESIGGITHDEWIAQLKCKAEAGDPDALETLRNQENFKQRLKRIHSVFGRRRKDVEFHKFKMEYLKKKKNEES